MEWWSLTVRVKGYAYVSVFVSICLSVCPFITACDRLQSLARTGSDYGFLSRPISHYNHVPAKDMHEQFHWFFHSEMHSISALHIYFTDIPSLVSFFTGTLGWVSFLIY